MASGLVTYTHGALSVADIVAMLKARGLAFADEARAMRELEMLSYFRLSAYLKPLEEDASVATVTHQYKSGATFEKAMELYDFDKRLRLLVFSAIQSIEIALRSRMIQVFSEARGAFWFMDMGLTNDERLLVQNLATLDREVQRSSDEFIKEHFRKYDRPTFPPAWKTMELATFGTLSKVFHNFADSAAKNAVARAFGVPRYVMLESWMASLAVLRNACAHHSRVWNKVMKSNPVLPAVMPRDWVANVAVDDRRIYARLCCLVYWLNAIDGENGFVEDLKALLVSHPNVDVAAMGFPEGWDEEPLWKDKKSTSDEDAGSDAVESDESVSETEASAEVQSTDAASEEVADGETASDVSTDGEASEKE